MNDMTPEDNFESQSTELGSSPIRRVRDPRGRMIGLLAISAMLGGVFGGAFGGGRSSYFERHDEERPKTKHDLERMEEARLRRERKAAKKQALKESNNAAV